MGPRGFAASAWSFCIIITILASFNRYWVRAVGQALAEHVMCIPSFILTVYNQSYVTVISRILQLRRLRPREDSNSFQNILFFLLSF